jgi:hypothetical protein
VLLDVLLLLLDVLLVLLDVYPMLLRDPVPLQAIKEMSCHKRKSSAKDFFLLAHTRQQYKNRSNKQLQCVTHKSGTSAVNFEVAQMYFLRYWEGP